MEPSADNREAQDKKSSSAASAAEIAGNAALSAVLATSLSAALVGPPDTKLMTLPEPTPIVQVYREKDEDPPEPPAEPVVDEKQLRRERWRKILRALFLALLLAGILIAALGRGCTACTALIPPQREAEQETQEEENSSDETQPACYTLGG